MGNASSVIKRGLLAFAQGVGAFHLVGNSTWRRQRLAILCYHGISLLDEHVWDPRLYHSPALFRSRREHLRDGGYNVLSLDEGLQRLESGTLPDRSIAITFDDGLYDFAAAAVPLLQEFGFPATIYVSSYYVEHPWPVFPPWCRYLLWVARERTVDLSRVIGAGAAVPLASEAQREAAFQAIYGHCNRTGMDGPSREALARRLEEHLEIDAAPLRARRILHLMTPVEVAAVSRAGFDVELHTHRHRSPFDAASFTEEIRRNRALLEQWGGKPANHLAYPSGVHAPEQLGWLRDLGVVSAVTSESGLAAPSSNPLLLPRVIDQQSLDAVEFEAWLTGVRALLPSRVNVTAIK